MVFKIQNTFTGLFLACCIIHVCSRQVISNGFNPQGPNVCRKTIIVNEPVKFFKVSHFTDVRQTSCGLFGFWRCTERRTATRSKYVMITKSKPVDSLNCCYGWRATVLGQAKICDKPICRRGCKHGKCVGADRCKCFSGWSGHFCERDVNECYQSNGFCQQVCTNTPGSFVCGCRKGYISHSVYRNRCEDLNECTKYQDLCKCANGQTCGAVCKNIVASYRCSCGSGFRLLRSTLCADINECLSSITNKCPGRCYNNIGSFSCHCMRGLRLSADGTKCEDVNECKTQYHNCHQICLNAYGTYRCQCRLGFKLHINRRRCEDVDECSMVNPCQMKCINTYGSYYCSCPEGYNLTEDKFRCSDVDECIYRRDCQQFCTNTVGSYVCSCRRGFRLDSAGKICIDVDECSNGAHKCNQKCHNTIGSYVCSCGRGYRLKSDKRTCRALRCESIENPAHGNMKCDGFTTGSRCLMKCNPSYDLIGSKERTCLSSGKWNGRRTVCKEKRCPKLFAPVNAEVILPCNGKLNSRCSLECEQGFYSNNGGIGGEANCVLDDLSGFAEWNLKNFKCSKLKHCQPNPCVNGGKCVVKGIEDFFCNCESTGFEGPRCEKGVITTPTYQRLKANQESKVYNLYARPRNELRVTIRSPQAILVKPQSELRISKVARQAAFTLVPKKPGMHIIAYALGGDDKKDFKVPAENTIFVGPDSVSQDNAYDTLQIQNRSLPEGCHKLPRPLFQCNARLTSTFPWGTPSATSTEGIVHLQTNSFKIPISLFGADVNELSQTRDNILSKIEETSLQSIPAGTDLSFVRDGKCHPTPMKKDYLFEFIQNDAMPRSIFKSLSSILPPWIQFQIDQSNDVFDVTNLMVSVGKPISDGSGMCEKLPISSSSIFFKPSIAFHSKIGDETKAFKSKDRVCLALDVCQKKAFVDLSSTAQQKFHQMKVLRDLSEAGWDFDIASLGFQDPSARTKESDFDVWMKTKAQVRIAGPQMKVAFNISGNILIKSECPSKLFSWRFTCKLSGSAKGMVQMTTLLKVGSSYEKFISLDSKIISGKFFFGGTQEEPCLKYQGIKLQLESSKTPLLDSRLSAYIFPLRNGSKYRMGISISHNLNGGGKIDILIPSDLVIKLTVLGYVAKEITRLDIHAKESKLSKDGANLQNQANTLYALVNIAKSITKRSKILKNNEARHFENAVKSVQSQIEKILALMSTLSLSLKTAEMKSKLQSIRNNLDSSKSLDYDVQRSPVIQRLDGISLSMMSQVCVGLCIPYVKAKISANNDDPSCQKKNSNPAPPKDHILPSLHLSSSRNAQLGKLFRIKEGEVIRLDVSKKMMQFKAMVNLFGMKKEIIVNTTRNQVKFRAKGNIFNKFESEINVTAAVSSRELYEWESLVFKVSGKMDQDSLLPRMLEASINQYAIKLLQKAEKRIRRENKKLVDKVAELGVVETNLAKSKLDTLDAARNKRLRLKGQAKLAKNIYLQKTYNFDDVFRQHLQFLRNNTMRCNLTECKPEYKDICVPEVCWERTNVTYQKPDCISVKTVVPEFKSIVMSYMVDYMTTPTIRKDVGKCKSFITAFLEGLVTSTVNSVILGRKKRSLGENVSSNTLHHQSLFPDVNDYLKAENPKLPRDFDIDVELRKQIPSLPKNFSMNTALRQYILRQHTIDVNQILKEYFPALSPDFDVDQVLGQIVPEFQKSFNFDDVLREVVLETQRRKRPIDFQKVLRQEIGEEVDLDRVLKKYSPMLRSIENITELIQKNLNEIFSFKLNDTLLKVFDVANVIKSKLHGSNQEIKKLLKVVLNLVLPSNINALITDVFKSNITNLDDIDLNGLIGSAMGINDFNLQKELNRHLAGLAKGLNLVKLIKDELQSMIIVDVNNSRLEELSFGNLIRNVVPMIKRFDINRILATVFPNLGRKFDFNTILKNVIPVLQMFGKVNVNSAISGLFPNSSNFDINRELKIRVPAFRGGPEISKLLSETLQEFFPPEVEKLLDLILPVSHPNKTNIFKEITGEDGLSTIQKVIDVARLLMGVMDAKQDGEENISDKFSKILVDGFLPEKVKKIGEAIVDAINTVPYGLDFSMVDGFVNAIANSGCNHKYVEVKGSTERLQYEKRIPILGARNTEVLKWFCNTRPASILSNALEPKFCCRKVRVKLQEPNCLKKLQECIKERETYFKQEQSLLEQYSKTELRELQMAEKEYIHTESKLVKAIFEEAAITDYIKSVDATRERLLAQVNTRNKSLSKIKAIPEIRLGLKMKTILKQPLRVSSLSFQTVSSSLSKSRITLKGTLATKDGPDSTFSFIMDLKDSSIKSHTAQRIIRELARSIERPRKRRSISSGEVEFNVSDVSEILENDKCVLAQNATYFFRDILMSLKRLLDSKYTQDRDMANELNSLHVFQDIFASSQRKSSSDAVLLNSYNEVISFYKNQRRKQKTSSRIKVITRWKDFVEDMTDARHLSRDCVGAVDCVEEFSEVLDGLYQPLKSNVQAREIRNILLKLVEGIKELLEEDVSTEEAESKLPNLLSLLTKMNNLNVLCGEKPKMLSTQNQKIERFIGESITMACDVKSQTKVIYTWRRDNAVVKVSHISGDLELKSLNETCQGLYRCEAANHMGSTFSGITALVMQRKPTIVEHPTDVQAPLSKESGVTFSCVSSAKSLQKTDLPKTAWFFQPYFSKWYVELTNENSNLLYLVPDNVEKSGYYFCEASLRHGNKTYTATSRKARLDVLQTTPSNPKIAVLFNITSPCAKLKSSCQREQVLNIPSSMDIIMKRHLTHLITTETGVPMKSISRMKYIPISNTIARIFFYVRGNMQFHQKQEADEVVNVFAEARLNLAGKLKRLTHALNATVLPTGYPRASIVGLADTLELLYVSPDCPLGQYLDDNGYMCVHCSPGTFKESLLEGECKPCPIGTYQPNSGQASCIKCVQDKTTLLRSTIDESQCIEKV